MEQRHWKKAGITTSLLGYGCMRLPTLPDGRIDEVRAEALLNTARDAGFFVYFSVPDAPVTVSFVPPAVAPCAAVTASAPGAYTARIATLRSTLCA